MNRHLREKIEVRMDKAYYQDNHTKLFNKDCRSMEELGDESIQVVCCSPPYWGLRRYSGEQELVWGSDNHCEHEWGEVEMVTTKGGGNRGVPEEWQRPSRAQAGQDSHSQFCSLCGAWKGSFGLEPTPEMYIEHTIEILREIRKVLRKDGVVFLNLGDSYYGGGFGTSPGGNEDFAERYPKQASNKGSADHEDRKLLGSLKKGHSVLKAKDLCLIPFRVAIAAQEDGWWVRSVIIWSKPNPMPESVTDRPTESHEYILMLTKSGATQYWTHRDHEGTRKQPEPDYRWINQKTKEEVSVKPEGWTPKNKMGWGRINLWQGHDYYWDAEAVREPINPNNTGKVAVRPSGDSRTRDKEHWGVPHEREMVIREYEEIKGRNIRSVWEFPTQPFSGFGELDHFAVFPEKLPEICIKAATPEVGCCSKCGAPYERITQETEEYSQARKHGGSNKAKDILLEGNRKDAPALTRQTETLGWQPTCECNADKVPSLVLDPFGGAGTVGWVAKKLNRRAILYELSEEYCQLSVERMRQQVLL